MASKYKVIENPSVEVIMACVSDGFFKKENLKEIKLYPFYYYSTFKVQQLDGNRIVLKDQFSGAVDAMNGSYYGGYMIFEAEHEPVKFACRIPELPGILSYYEQRFGYLERFEPAEHFYKSPVHYTTIRTALSHTNAFKANGFIATKFTKGSYLEFCGITNFSQGGSYHEFGFDHYNHKTKGIELQRYDTKEKMMITWQEQADALTEMLKAAQPPVVGEVKKEWIQVPLF
jgi:hypothetical protein